MHYSSDQWNNDESSDGINVFERNDAANLNEDLEDEVTTTIAVPAAKRRRVIARRKHHTLDEREVIDRSYSHFKARVLTDDMYAPLDELTAHAINAINEAINDLQKGGTVQVTPSMTRVVSLIVHLLSLHQCNHAKGSRLYSNIPIWHAPCFPFRGRNVLQLRGPQTQTRFERRKHQTSSCSSE